MRITALPLLLFFAGCEIGEKSSNADLKEVDAHLDGVIILMCEGESSVEIDPAKRGAQPAGLIKFIEEKGNTPAAYLIKVEDRDESDHFEYFWPDENRFMPSTCFFEFNECKASVDPDILSEFGRFIDTNTGAVLEMTETIINRRTGAMRTVRTSMGVNYNFDGFCKPGQIPEQPPQKF